MKFTPEGRIDLRLADLIELCRTKGIDPEIARIVISTPMPEDMKPGQHATLRRPEIDPWELSFSPTRIVLAMAPVDLEGLAGADAPRRVS